VKPAVIALVATAVLAGGAAVAVGTVAGPDVTTSHDVITNQEAPTASTGPPTPGTGALDVPRSPRPTSNGRASPPADPTPTDTITSTPASSASSSPEQSPGAPGAAGDATGSAQVCGTWVLQQVTPAAQVLPRVPASLTRSLLFSDLRGLSLSYPWRLADDDLSLLDSGLEAARRFGVDYSVRFMAGQHTPTRIFDAGAHYYEQSGHKVPKPFADDGTAGNPSFEAAYDAYLAKLVAWARAHDVHLVHLPWYGQDWAELNHGNEVRAARGYSYTSWLEGHKRLIDIGLKYAGNGVAVEWPMSGSGPLIDGAHELTAYIVAKAGPLSPDVYVQANGLSPNGDWGAPSASVESQMDASVWPQDVLRGEQMIRPYAYDWPALYGHLRANGARYVEVYVQSFGLGNAVELQREISAFDARFDSSCQLR